MSWLRSDQKKPASTPAYLLGGGFDSDEAPIMRRGYDTGIGVDKNLICFVVALLVLGSVMVYSASITLADSPKYNTTHYHFFIRHVFSIAVATVGGCIVYMVPMRTWNRLARPLLLASMLLLVLVLVPYVGKSINGSRRWINLGIMSLQVTEAVKFAAVLAAAWYTVQRQDYMHSLTKGFIPMAVVMAVGALLIMSQPDLGAVIVIACISLGVLFLGGINLNIFAGIVIIVVAVVAFLIYDSPWRVGRVLAYLDPWGKDYALDKAYQLSHSLIAFGRGELFGVGLGASVEKLHYLPEAHTDFILAVIGEELGLAGVVAVLFCHYMIVRKAFAIGRQAIKLDRVFSGLIAEGVGIWIGVQVVFNGGVATGLLPTKGLTLPLVSFGGSSLLATIAAIGLVLRVDKENKILMRGGRV